MPRLFSRRVEMRLQRLSERPQHGRSDRLVMFGTYTVFHRVFAPQIAQRRPDSVEMIEAVHNRRQRIRLVP